MNVEQIKQVSKTKYLHHIARLNLQERAHSKLLVTQNGGSWRVTQELISFLSVIDDEYVILIDIYDNPCRVERVKLLEQCKETYRTVMDQWFSDAEKINKQR
jgi:hypothetical protein